MKNKEKNTEIALIEEELDKAYIKLEEAREVVRKVHTGHVELQDELDAIDKAIRAVKCVEIVVKQKRGPLALPPEKDNLALISETSLCCGVS